MSHILPPTSGAWISGVCGIARCTVHRRDFRSQIYRKTLWALLSWGSSWDAVARVGPNGNLNVTFCVRECARACKLHSSLESNLEHGWFISKFTNYI